MYKYSHILYLAYFILIYYFVGVGCISAVTCIWRIIQFHLVSSPWIICGSWWCDSKPFHLVCHLSCLYTNYFLWKIFQAVSSVLTVHLKIHADLGVTCTHAHFPIAIIFFSHCQGLQKIILKVLTSTRQRPIKTYYNN